MVECWSGYYSATYESFTRSRRQGTMAVILARGFRDSGCSCFRVIGFLEVKASRHNDVIFVTVSIEISHQITDWLQWWTIVPSLSEFTNELQDSLIHDMLFGCYSPIGWPSQHRYSADVPDH